MRTSVASCALLYLLAFLFLPILSVNCQGGGGGGGNGGGGHGGSPGGGNGGATTPFSRVISSSSSSLFSSSSSSSSRFSSSSSTAAVVSATASSSALTYEIEVGPYEVVSDETAAYEKSAVAESQSGVPITYLMAVVNGTTGSPLTGARLDYWAANAQGLYSGESAESTSGLDYMRGWQYSAAGTGLVNITSILSGPYAGRTNHIHFRVRMYTDSTYTSTSYDDTTQLFFPADITEAIMTQVTAYDRTNADSWATTNSNDKLYQLANQMTLTGSIATGYVAQYTIVAPLTNCNDC